MMVMMYSGDSIVIVVAFSMMMVSVSSNHDGVDNYDLKDCDIIILILHMISINDNLKLHILMYCMFTRMSGHY